LAGDLSNTKDMRPTRLILNRFGLFIIILCGLVIIYVLTYTVLSLNGGYAFTLADIGRLEGFSWAPAGLYSEPTTKNETAWFYRMFYFFYPLLRIDGAYFHPPKECYITGNDVKQWKNNRQIGDFDYLSRQLPATVPTDIVTSVLGTPTRTNLLANGLSRWEYDYHSSNSVAFGSLFFSRRRVFQGSSTNENAQAPSLIRTQTLRPAGEE
jgi:hypothetical protein